MKRLTGTQKTAIREFRAAGLGYKAIAEKLSLSRETVRSFCSRNDIPSRRDANTSVTETKASTEMKQGGTVFIITTGYSEKASEPLEKKLEKLILDAVAKQSRCYQFVQESA